MRYGRSKFLEECEFAHKMRNVLKRILQKEKLQNLLFKNSNHKVLFKVQKRIFFSRYSASEGSASEIYCEINNEYDLFNEYDE